MKFQNRPRLAKAKCHFPRYLEYSHDTETAAEENKLLHLFHKLKPRKISLHTNTVGV